MTDLIDRQAIIAKLTPWLSVDGYSEGETNMLNAVLYELKNMPSAEPVRHGKWIHRWSGCGSVWLEQRCSECGLTLEEEPIDYNYCPHCGARMDEE